VKLRVLTFNIWNNQGDAARRIALINRELRELEPDLVALQEVLHDDANDQMPALFDGSELNATHQADVMPIAPPFAEKFGGTAIASRFPHRIVEVLDQRGVGAMDVPWCTLAANVDLPGLGGVLFIATTGAWRSAAEATRERQVLALTELDARHRTELPTIIAGDFNASPDAASIRFMRGLQSLGGRSVHYNDAWAVAGEGDGFTWTHANPNAEREIGRIVGQPNHARRLDYVFTGGWDAHPSAFARITSVQLAFDHPIEGVWLSDHFGVCAEIDVGKAE
jgi:endonuclease/exonuclease/phosphatase family metal-dependent hydrolase